MERMVIPPGILEKMVAGAVPCRASGFQVIYPPGRTGGNAAILFQVETNNTLSLIAISVNVGGFGPLQDKSVGVGF